ncbi:MAG: hypothetical protein ACLT29_02565 [Ruminococcus callidus]
MESGAAYTGWTAKDGGKLYMTENGAASGLITINGDVYYFNPSTFFMHWLGDRRGHFPLLDPTTGI